MAGVPQALLDRMKERRTIAQFEYAEGEGWFFSESLSPVEMAKAYHIAADYLVEGAVSEENEPIFIWPILFLYRHAAELYLKRALALVASESKSRNHDILGLWSSLQDSLLKWESLKHLQGKLLPTEEELDSLMEFHSLSPASTELRYADSDLVGGKGHSLFANFRNAQFHARRMSEYFARLENLLATSGATSRPEEASQG